MKKEMTLRDFQVSGGKASVKSRFKGKTKKQISEIMRDVQNGRNKSKLNNAE